MLTVVGTLALDTLARVRALPAPEQTSAVIDLAPDAPGGTAGNVAMALARLGLRTRVLSAVGPEFAGSAYAQALASVGVDLDDVQVEALPTSRAYVVVDEHGAQTTLFYAGASKRFSASPALIEGRRVHFCAGEISAYPSLMGAAAWVSFDPGQELFHREFREIEACFAHADVLFLNQRELDVCERHGWDVRRALDAGASIVVETRGREGTLVHTKEGRFAAPAVPVKPVDPTGAGDAHRAGFLFALDRGADLGVAARFANVLGSFAVEHVGAQQGHPTLAHAIERYEKAFGGKPF